MTRGTAYLITDKQLYYSDEFNGEMYPSGYGKDFLRLVNNTTVESFKNDMKNFNDSHHNYENFETCEIPLSKWDIIKSNKTINIDMTDRYFEFFFSDWIFFKNLSTKTIKLKVEDKTQLGYVNFITVKIGESVAVNFGSYANHYFYN